jgi:hypothetical protein
MIGLLPDKSILKKEQKECSRNRRILYGKLNIQDTTEECESVGRQYSSTVKIICYQ